MLLVLLALACNVTPIEDGGLVGPLIQVQTSFTSALIGVPPEGGPIAFDAGFQRSGRRVERVLAERSLSLDDLGEVFLTHHHTDHIAGIASMGEEIIAHVDEVEPLAGEAIVVDRTVEDGDVIDVGGWDVEVFHVPGHTPGSAVYLVEGVLVMGDVAIQQRDGTVGPSPDNFSDDPAQAQQELCRLIERVRDRTDITRVAYAHSGPSDLAGLLAAEGC